MGREGSRRCSRRWLVVCWLGCVGAWSLGGEARAAQNETERRPEWLVWGAVAAVPAAVAATPVVIGPSAGLRRRLVGPLVLGAWLFLARSEQANVSWRMSRLHASTRLTVAAETLVGVGRLWAGVTAGLEGIVETARRHGSVRLEAMDIDARERGWTVGPHLGAEAGVILDVYGGMGLWFSGGPSLSVQRVSGRSRSSWGVSSAVGVTYGFE